MASRTFDGPLGGCRLRQGRLLVESEADQDQLMFKDSDKSDALVVMN